MTMYISTSTTDWPNTTNTSPGFWTAAATAGELLTNTANGTFRNDFGVRCTASITWSTKRVSNGFGTSQFWINGDTGGLRLGRVTNGGVDWMTTSASLILFPGESFTLIGYQDSGSDLAFVTQSSLSIQIYFY